jgi:hypothetical protein
MPERSMVVISKHWHTPEINLTVNTEGLQLAMPLDDFCKALVQEVAHPAFTLTKSGLEANLLTSMEKVISKMKEASVHVPVMAQPTEVSPE